MHKRDANVPNPTKKDGNGASKKVLTCLEEFALVPLRVQKFDRK